MQLTIEKLIYGGDGLARQMREGEARAKTIFVPFVLPGEKILGAPVEEKSGFVRARAEQILDASPQRVIPRCPYFQACGGCHYQHAAYELQLSLKEHILRETLLRTAKLDWQNQIHLHPSPPWNYRNRTRMKLRVSPFAVGYYKFNSHELLPVQQCPISSPLINAAIAALWQIAPEHPLPDGVEEIEFFANADDCELLLTFYCGAGFEIKSAEFLNLAQRAKALLPQIKGISAAQAQLPPSTHDAPQNIFGDSHLTYKTSSGSYRVSAGSFFQVNRFLIDELVQTVVAAGRGESALDLYAGTGLFSVELARRVKKITAVEVATASFYDLQSNLAGNGHAVRQSTAQFLQTNRRQFDFVVADPPRAGLGDSIARNLAEAARTEICYVSCDPATLARDLKVLLAAGFHLRELHLFDLFPQTFHLETVALLQR